MRQRRGQSIVEYTMIISIVVVVLSYMGTSIKRGMQSLVKVTADQVGNQQNADQDFNDAQQGFMQNSITATEEINNRQVNEAYGVTNIQYDEFSNSTTTAYTNGGFSPNN